MGVGVGVGGIDSSWLLSYFYTAMTLSSGLNGGQLVAFPFLSWSTSGRCSAHLWRVSEQSDWLWESSRPRACEGSAVPARLLRKGEAPSHQQAQTPTSAGLIPQCTGHGLNGILFQTGRSL